MKRSEMIEELALVLKYLSIKHPDLQEVAHIMLYTVEAHGMRPPKIDKDGAILIGHSAERWERE